MQEQSAAILPPTNATEGALNMIRKVWGERGCSTVFLGAVFLIKVFSLAKWFVYFVPCDEKKQLGWDGF